VMTTHAADVEKDLWLYLPLNDGAGKAPEDHGPHGFKTELSKKAPKWVTNTGHAKIKGAPEFDGKENFVMIDMAGQKNDIDSHFDDKKGLSICAWVKVLKVGTDAHGQTRQPIVMKGAGGAWEFSLYVYDDFGAGMSVWNCGGGGVSEPHTAATLTAGKWHHQCGTFKVKEGVKVYVDADAKPVAQAADGGGACDTGIRPVFIAHREDGQWLNAQIAEVWMWDRIIDVAEMELAMNTVGGLAVNPADKLPSTWGKIKGGRF
jgi:hypothetical protein